MRLAIAALVVLGLFAIGARCIENVAVRQDEAGYTYLLGEIYNDTDIPGARMLLRASLLDAAGNVVAWKDTATCPPDLQPHGLSSYAVRFDELNLPPGLRYEVRAVGGRTLEAPLPDPEIIVQESGAVRDGADLDVTFVVRNDSPRTYLDPQLCAVMYDGAGKVGSWSPFDPTKYTGDNALTSSDSVNFSFRLRDQAADAARVRIWLWIPGSESGTSPYQPVMTEALLIID